MELTFCILAIAGLLMLTPGYCYPPSVNVNNTECCLTVPKSVDDCISSSKHHPISSKSANVDCLNRLLWNTKHEQVLSAKDELYFSLLSKDSFKKGVPQPKTGFRIRKEYRLYTDAERTRLHNAFQNLYKKGVLRKYAELHRRAIKTAHNSPVYLPWHRVFLAMLEDELRLEDNTVSLPYWDTTLDAGMDNPVNSIIWSSKFLGNANGDVITGPFSGWKTARGNLWREYGSHPRGKLFSEEMIKKILTKCKTNDIVFPIKSPNVKGAKDYILEYHNNGAHNWVSGDMSDKHFAAYDPVFYMLQAFIDFLWEQFRLRQQTICGVDPETDYPSIGTMPGTMPNASMEGFDGFKNIEGLKHYWTQNWYNYENNPRCPDCGSKYLFCNNIKGSCVSHSRRKDYNAGLHIKTPLVQPLGLPAEPFEPKTELIPKHIFSKFLPAPLRDKRTRESAKYDAKKAASPLGSQSKYPLPATVQTPRIRLNNNLPAPSKGQNTKESIHNVAVANNNVASTQKPVLPQQSGMVPLATNTLHKHLNQGSNGNAKHSSGNNNKTNPFNIGALLNIYVNMLKHNLSALVSHGHSTTKNNQTLAAKVTPKPTKQTKGSSNTQQLPLIDLANIMSQTHPPKSKPISRRRKYLSFT